MRSAYLILVFISTVVLAKPLTLTELLKESDAIKKKIETQKTFESKKAELQKLENLLQTTMNTYEAESPNEGGKDEYQVNKLFFSMEPVFEMSKVKPSKIECEKAEHRIRLEDRDNTKPDPNELSVQAKDAIAMLKLFCKN